jgi:hypothetical protein
MLGGWFFPGPSLASRKGHGAAAVAFRWHDGSATLATVKGARRHGHGTEGSDDLGAGWSTAEVRHHF